MKSKFLLIFAAFTMLAQSPTLDELKTRVYEFEKHYDKFFRKLYGCPAEGQLSGEFCSSGRSTVDYREYELARRAAKRLFP